MTKVIITKRSILISLFLLLLIPVLAEGRHSGATDQFFKPESQIASANTYYPASSLLEIASKTVEGITIISVLTDGLIDYRTESISNPDRYIIDLMDITNRLPQYVYTMDSPFVKQVRASQYQVDPRLITRIVLDLKNKVIPDIATNGNEMIISVSVAGSGENGATSSESLPDVTELPAKSQQEEFSSAVEDSATEPEMNAENTEQAPDPIASLWAEESASVDSGETSVITETDEAPAQEAEGWSWSESEAPDETEEPSPETMEAPVSRSLRFFCTHVSPMPQAGGPCPSKSGD